MDNSAIKSQVLEGLGWSFVSQTGRQVVQLAITAVLARLLSPEDFGLLGMAIVFTGFLMLMNEKGFASALIQRQDLDETHYSSVFWINASAGLLITVLFVLAAPALAAFYDKPELENIFACLSVNFAVASVVIVPRAILTKRMDFKKLAAAETISVIAGGAAGILLALRGYGVWALVFQQLALNLSMTVALWFLSPWKPSFVFSGDSVREVSGFGAKVSGAYVLSYIQRNIDYLLIGRFLGAEALGYYTLAYKLMLYPIQNISWVVSKVTFPAFARIQGDLEKVRAGYLKVVKAVSLVNFPLLCGLFVLAPEFVRAVFGPSWEPAVGLIRIFCVCGVIQTIGTTVGDIFLSQGRIDLQLKMDAAFAALMAAALSAGLTAGVYGVALMYTFVESVWCPYAVFRSGRLIGLNMRPFGLQVLRSLSLGFAMAGLLCALKPFVAGSDLGTLLVLTAVGAGVYAALVAAFEKDFIWSLRRT